MKSISMLTKNLTLAAALLSMATLSAKEKYGSVFKQHSSQKVMAACSPPQGREELALNNVRTIIFSGSDMWWDLFGAGNAYYVIPKVSDKAKWISSNFSGNVWFSGIDNTSTLKVAAQTYRQDGIDFWTGPINLVTKQADDPAICTRYDKLFRITKKEVQDFAAGGPITQAIRDWPGNGPGTSYDDVLAPYLDKNGFPKFGDYDVDAGDRPGYDLSVTGMGKDALGVCKARLFGDETLWWIYNDVGGVHAASQGNPIGMEIRAQAFAFKTTDEINNMTFYNYEIINRSAFTLNNTYMAVWTDADLGYYGDDYIGCDIGRGLGYIYNADAFDESVSGTNGYGAYIPAFGCDFFQGPLANLGDGIDNDLDGTTDETGEQIIMSNFTYFNNSFPGVPLQTTDPQNATQVRNYMTGFWRDGTPFTCGGNGYGGSVPTKYVYPDNSYPTNGSTPMTCGMGWNEAAAGNVPGDRRFVQSAGPFTLNSGAINYITFGLPWARTTIAGNPQSSIDLLKTADDKAQALFDNCFQVLNGPEAPDLTIQEMDNELILFLTNKPGSNNYLGAYTEKDVTILPNTACGPGSPLANPDQFYRFEGYKIYQLKSEAITQEELLDENKAKLAFQCDIKNGVSKLINFNLDQALGGDVPKVMVDGADNGIQTTFHFTKDLFSASADQKVINNKTFYFMVVAYGYNNFLTYKEDVDCSQDQLNNKYGQKRPYLEGRISKKAYAIPHNTDAEKGGTVLNSYYGYGPKITRMEGQGNGGNILDLTQASIDEIFNAGGNRVANITYENGRGPVNVRVVDPLNVPNAEFTLKFIDIKDVANHQAAPKTKDMIYGRVNPDSTSWALTNNTTNKIYFPGKSIKLKEEFYFSELGLSVSLAQSTDAGQSMPIIDSIKAFQPGDFLEGSISFAESTTPWLTGVPDRDGSNYQGVNDNGFNWIRSGTYRDKASTPNTSQDDYMWREDYYVDPSSEFEKILGGTWAPYSLVAHSRISAGNLEAPAGPGYRDLYSTDNTFSAPLDNRTIASVDIVITTDKSKWTRALVLEECDEATLAVNGARKLETRRSRSVDKQGVPLGTPGCNVGEASFDSIPGQPHQYGLGWFPGYAINIETGERLSIAFGEDSYQTNHGRDMMWNPTSVESTPNYPFTFGGRHYIYVFGNNRGKVNYSNIDPALDGYQVGAGNYSSFQNMAYMYKRTYGATAPKLGIAFRNIMADGMWVNIPLTSKAQFEFNDPSNMPCDVKVRLRVKKAYRYGYATHETPQGPLIKASYPSTDASPYTYSLLQRPNDTATAALNNNYPMYKFSTADIYAQTNQGSTAKNALDLIRVVPNPYYGYSTYETQNRLDSRVRITNLPNKCKVRIYTLNGTLVRVIDRDVTGQEDLTVKEVSEFQRGKYVSFQDWDLKNQSGIPVASGLYIFHIDAPGVGEKIVKWFGVMRPLDLQNY